MSEGSNVFGSVGPSHLFIGRSSKNREIGPKELRLWLPANESCVYLCYISAGMSGSASSKALQWYQANATEAAARHEALNPAKVHHWWLDQLPNSPAVILDAGAGTGRDAAWLAAKKHDVIAVEPGVIG